MSDIQQAANGRWCEILTGLGADAHALDGKNRPCPSCGGQDRFYFDDEGGRGTHGCRHCGAGDGFELVKKMLGYSDFPDVANAVGGVIGFGGKRPSKADQAVYKRKLDAQRKANAVEEAQRHADAATKAQHQWDSAEPAKPDHPYLVAKQVQPYGLQQVDDCLLVPVRINGEITSLQRIASDGSKTFTTGSKVGGGYHSIAGSDGTGMDRIYIAEGYATAATIREAVGCPVAVAFNAGNLGQVAIAIRAKLPDVQIIIVADNDHTKADNVGLKKAIAAAKTVGGIVTYPVFETSENGSDWNDYAAIHGLDAVRESITSQVTVFTEKPTEPLPNDDCVRFEPKERKGVTEESHTNFVDVKEETTQSEALEPESYEAMVERLAGMKPHEYDQIRKSTAKAIDVRATTLDDAVGAVRKREQSAQSFFTEIEPWDAPVDGKALVEEIVATFRRFVFLPAHAGIALALWSINTFTHDASYFSPIIVLTSPEKRCGKSTALAVLSALCRWSLPAGNVSAAVVFRAIELWHPTLLIDEVDTFLAQDEGLAGVINSGHSKAGARVLRCEGDSNEPKAFSTWCPKVLAGIGRIRGTLEDRAIIIQLCRKLDGEQVERLRLDRGGFSDIQRRCQRWGDDHFDAIQGYDAPIPNELHDRAADNWMPLLAIADLCGVGNEARTAALALSGCDESDSVNAILLQDIKGVFERLQIDRISSADLCVHLIDLEDRPWGEWTRGRPITTNKLAGRLKTFGIHSGTIRLVGGAVTRGYYLKNFKDSFIRYIPVSKCYNVTTLTQPQKMEVSKCYKGEDVTLSKSLEPLGGNGCNNVTLLTPQVAEGKPNDNLTPEDLAGYDF